MVGKCELAPVRDVEGYRRLCRDCNYVEKPGSLRARDDCNEVCKGCWYGRELNVDMLELCMKCTQEYCRQNKAVIGSKLKNKCTGFVNKHDWTNGTG